MCNNKLIAYTKAFTRKRLVNDRGAIDPRSGVEYMVSVARQAKGLMTYLRPKSHVAKVDGYLRNIVETGSDVAKCL